MTYAFRQALILLRLGRATLQFGGKHQITKTSISIIIVVFQEMRLGCLPLRTTVGWICSCRCPDQRKCAGRPGRTARLCRRRRAADTSVGSSTIGRPGGSWWSPLFFEARSLAITVDCGARSRKPDPSRLNDYLVTTVASSARISPHPLPRLTQRRTERASTLMRSASHPIARTSHECTRREHYDTTASDSIPRMIKRRG